MADDNNELIKELRSMIDKANTQAKTEREAREALELKFNTTQEELNTLKRSKLDEVERLKAENSDFVKKFSDLETKIKELTGTAERSAKQDEFINQLYQQRLSTVDEKKRAEIDILAKIEGDPIGSLTKLDSVIKLLNPGQAGGVVVGTITNPPGGLPNSENDPNPTDGVKKLDPKTIGWDGIFKPVEEIKKTAKEAVL